MQYTRQLDYLRLQDGLDDCHPVNCTMSPRNWVRRVYQPDCILTLFESQHLYGLTGDNGEQYVVFVSLPGSPMSSGWRWFHNLAEAILWMDNFLRWCD